MAVRSDTQAVELGQLRQQAAVLGSIDTPVIATDLGGLIFYMNSAAEQATAWTPQDAIGANWREVFRIDTVEDRPPDEPKAVGAMLVAAGGEATLLGRDGTERIIEYRPAPILSDSGEVSGLVVVFTDVAERKLLEQQAHYDHLTGLPNRVLFRERLRQAMRRADRADTKMAVMFLDLDRFKDVNDTMGHELGDRLLIKVTRRILAVLRDVDTVARWGGDEFTVLIEGANDVNAAATVARKVIDTTAEPIQLDGNDFWIGASVGLSVYPDDATDSGTLMKYADIAMYVAKGAGGHRFQFFSEDMNKNVLQRTSLAKQLRTAFDQRQFVLHYQPLVDVAGGGMCGMEALLRWRRDDELVSPGLFIPVLEETGLIVQVGEWALHAALEQYAAWLAAGLTPPRVSVNVSSQQFRKLDVVESVRGALGTNGLPAGALGIELTESLLLEDTQASIITLYALREMGVAVSIDDFGTGYSSLSYLRRFPVDTVKIDRSFVSDMEHERDDATTIVRAVIALTRSLQLSVLAEGVETEQQASLLVAHGCTRMQGYLFSRPLAAEAIEDLLSSEDSELVAAVHAAQTVAAGAAQQNSAGRR